MTMTINAAVNVILTVNCDRKRDCERDVFYCYGQLHSTIIKLFKEQILNFWKKLRAFQPSKLSCPSIKVTFQNISV